MVDDTRRYLVVLRLGDTAAERLTILVPSLKAVLESLAVGPIEQAFRSVSADVFGYFVRSKLNSAQIHAAIQSPGPESWERHSRKPDIGPFLDNKDALLIVELGEDWLVGIGFTKVGPWLRHH